MSTLVRDESDQPHFLGLGFENWSFGHDYTNMTFETGKESTLISPSVGTMRRKCSGRRENFHTSLKFTRPSDHPLSKIRRRVPTLPEKSRLQRRSSSQASDAEVTCVSFLGVGGWDETDEVEHALDKASVGGETPIGRVPGHQWTVQVDSRSYQPGETPWFKFVKQDGDGCVWLEGGEIFVLIESLKGKTESVCVHILVDDSTTTVPLIEADEFFSAIIAAPRIEESIAVSMAKDALLTKHLQTIDQSQCSPVPASRQYTCLRR